MVCAREEAVVKSPVSGSEMTFEWGYLYMPMLDPDFLTTLALPSAGFICVPR